jgi:ATP-dependent RNA helicase RhlE
VLTSASTGSTTAPATSDESIAPAQPAQDGTVTFRSLGLSEALLRDLAQAKFTDPTPIQAKAIPPGLAGRDVLGCAQTGTGKTAAFVIPMIERLAGGPVGPPRGLILTPTRELAFQIQRTIGLLGRSRRVSATALVGGEDLRIQVRGLHQRPTIVVATPGRLLDHMWNGTVNLAHFTIVVLDEADRMLDMGFAPQLNQILDALSPERQTMLFSATMPDNLDGLARAGLKNPVQVMVNPPATAAHTVTHEVHHTTHDDKITLLLNLIQDPAGSVLVFTRTKHRADRLGTALEHKGHRVAVLHAGRRLSQRRAALEGFRRGTYRILVATDIAARGIDVANIGHVVNFDLPNTPEDYVHRIGRTGRMKAIGRATSFVTGEDHFQLRAIEKLLGRPVPRAAGSPPPQSHGAASSRGPAHRGGGRPGYGAGGPRRNDGYRTGESHRRTDAPHRREFNRPVDGNRFADAGRTGPSQHKGFPQQGQAQQDHAARAHVHAADAASHHRRPRRMFIQPKSGS